MGIEQIETKNETNFSKKTHSRYLDLTISSRNLWQALQIGQISLKVDEKGEVAEKRLDFSTPAMKRSSRQFHLSLQDQDFHSSFMEALMYKTKILAHWSETLSNGILINYGAEFYQHRFDQSNAHGEMSRIFGPKIGIEKNRMTDGAKRELTHYTQLGLTIAGEATSKSLISLDLNRKLALSESTLLTFNLRGLRSFDNENSLRGTLSLRSSIKRLVSGRNELTLKVALGRSYDEASEKKYYGSALNLGVVYNGENINSSFTITIHNK